MPDRMMEKRRLSHIKICVKGVCYKQNWLNSKVTKVEMCN